MDEDMAGRINVAAETASAALALASRIMIHLAVDGPGKDVALEMLRDCIRAMQDSRQPYAQELLTELAQQIDENAPDDPQ